MYAAEFPAGRQDDREKRGQGDGVRAMTLCFAWSLFCRHRLALSRVLPPDPAIWPPTCPLSCEFFFAGPHPIEFNLLN